MHCENHAFSGTEELHWHREHVASLTLETTYKLQVLKKMSTALKPKGQEFACHGGMYICTYMVANLLYNVRQ